VFADVRAAQLHDFEDMKDLESLLMNNQKDFEATVSAASHHSIALMPNLV
jgi:hypothetical protein